jgi:indole-3-glycerol phosphate synthase
MFLEKILFEKRREVEERKKRFPIGRMEVDSSRKPGRFKSALKKPGLSVIAEFKRKSPSAGLIRGNAGPSAVASEYERGGADAISVLTDYRFFGGSMDDFRDAKQSVRIPVLRKEFIIDGYQISESALSGADAVLLIVRALDKASLQGLLDLTAALGMDALVEAHDASELETALEAGAFLIGVNNRNLDTLRVDIQTSLDLVRLIPEGKIKVSESGIRSREDALLMEQAGFDAVLVGETLMRSGDPGNALRLIKGMTP